MPVTPFEIMTSKVWAMGLVVLAASALSLIFIVQGLLSVPIEGSLALFLVGTALHLFATTSMGIYLGTLARSMPQFGLLMMLVLLPLQVLSGGTTPRESMPEAIQYLMLAAPNTHFVMLAQAILSTAAPASRPSGRSFWRLRWSAQRCSACRSPASARRSRRWHDRQR